MLESPPAVLPLRYPQQWKDYALLDSGNGLKWERFGERILQRPEPQALWAPVESQAALRKSAHWRFEAGGSRSGQWLGNGPGAAGDRWSLSYQSPALKLRFQLEFNSLYFFKVQTDVENSKLKTKRNRTRLSDQKRKHSGFSRDIKC